VGLAVELDDELDDDFDVDLDEDLDLVGVVAAPIESTSS
jgi:hypothetical protein